MVRVSRWTAATLTAAFLLLGLLLAGVKVVRASSVEDKPTAITTEDKAIGGDDRSSAEVVASKHEIVGYVLDGTDRPIGGADVGLQPRLWYWVEGLPPSRFAATARTDSSGKFRLSVPEQINVSRGKVSGVWAIADGYQPSGMAMYVWGILNGFTKNTEVTVKLAPSAGTILRIVGANGEPVSGVRVIVQSQVVSEQFYAPIPPDWVNRVTGVTGTDGRVRVANAIPEAVSEVNLQPPGQSAAIQLGRDFFLNRRPATSPPHFTCTLPATGNIDGRLDTQDAKLPSDLKITIQTQSHLPNGPEIGTSGLATVPVDADGRFTVTGIAEGPITVRPFLDEEQPLRAEVPVGLAVHPGKTTVLSIPVRSGVLVHGLIRKQDTKQGYPHFSLGLIYGQSAREHRDMRDRYELETDENGRFSATVPPGPIELRLNSAPGDYREVESWKRESESELNIFGIRIQAEYKAPASKQPPYLASRRGLWGRQFDVPAGKESVDLEPIELVPADSISGSLVDRDGKPLGGDAWTVIGFPDIPGDVSNSFGGTVVGKDGRFSGSYPRTYPPVRWTVSHRRWPTPYESVDDEVDVKVISQKPLILQASYRSSDETKAEKATPTLRAAPAPNGATFAPRPTRQPLLPPEAVVTRDKNGDIRKIALRGHSDSDKATVSRETIQQIASIPTLEWLDLSFSDASDEALEPLKELRSLEGLDVSLSNATGRTIRTVSKLPHLLSLRMDCCKVNDDDLQVLADMPQLVNLYLGETLVTDAGLPSIGKLPRLVDLNLCNCAITDKGLPSLGHFKYLHHLWLSKTIRYGENDRSQLTDASVEYLSTLTTLIDLKIADSRLTDEGLSRLHKALPKAHIDTTRTGTTYILRGQSSGGPPRPALRSK